MSRKHLALVTALAALAALAFAASATSSASTSAAQPQRSTAATGTTSTTTRVGAVTVRLQIKKFVRRGKRIFAVGTAISRFNPSPAKAGDLPSATVRKAFTARVIKVKRFSSAQRICPVLDLTLGPLDLNLLGLIVHLDRVHLSITADSNGGLLGRLLCSVSGRFTPRQIVLNWTRAAQRSGLATKGVTVGVPLYQTTSSNGTSTLSTSSGAISPLMICPVLELTLGPLDLNLLGLIVHLDTVHLVITADSEGGILGQLLCGLAGAPAP
jgi:hypothetical protein